MSGLHDTFDPPSLGYLPDIAVVQQTYDVLVFRNPDLSLRPALATSWETNEDATQWTFHLRKGVRFSHGKEFKAEDVVFTFKRLFEVGSAPSRPLSIPPLTSEMARPTNVLALDDYTVRFDFASPNAVLLDSLVRPQAHITPSDVDPARFATETIGTGPFIMTEHVAGQSTTFIKNPNYWLDGVPQVDEVIFFYANDAETRTALLITGEVDMTYDLDIGSVRHLEDRPDTVVAQAPSGKYMNLVMDVRQPPFDNILVRRALQAATDREAVLQGAQFGMGGVAYDHPVAEGSPVFNPSCKPPDYDPELARALLAEAGYPNGIDLTLYTAAGSGAPMLEMAEVFAERAAAAGINVSIVQTDFNGYWSDVWMVQSFTTAWWSGRSPYEAFNIVYRSDAVWNESYYVNPEIDLLLDQALREAGLEGQKRTFGELQCLAVEDVPRIIPVFQPVLLGLRDDVRGVEPMWDGSLSLHRAWLDRTSSTTTPTPAPATPAATATAPTARAEIPLTVSQVVDIPGSPVGWSDHTATLLDDGTVLIVSGQATSHLPSRRALLYNPDSRQFSDTGKPRCLHSLGTATATKLLDGRVLVLGGFGAPQCAEIYDPAAKAFSLTGQPYAEKRGHTATLLSDGRVLVAGGWEAEEVISVAEIYDPETGEFTRISDLNERRHSHGSVLLEDVRVLIFGGYSPDNEIFDPKTLSFRTVPTTRSGGRAIGVLGNDADVFVLYDGIPFAGLFDPESETERAIDDRTLSRVYPAITLLSDGRVMISGGSTAGFGGTEGTLTSIEIYDPETKLFTEVAQLNVARFHHTAILLTDGSVLIVGGCQNGEAACWGQDLQSYVYVTELIE